MIEKLSHCITTCHNPYANIAREAYLLRSVEPGEVILYLWQNERTVVIGRNQNAWREARVAELEADGGHLTRRLSGGGAVFHDLGNLNFTFLARKEDYSKERQTEVILQAVRLLGLDAQLTGRNDLTIDGRKFSGHAYYEEDGHCYHHGTLLLDTDGALMQRYLAPSKAKLESKGVASVRSRVINLVEVLPDITVETMEEALIVAFQKVYGLTSTLRAEDSVEDKAAISALTDYFSSWEWLYGRKVPFTTSVSNRFDWGEVELQLQVDCGSIVDARIYTDALDESAFVGVEESLKGLHFTPEAIASAIEDPGSTNPCRSDLAELVRGQDW